MIIIIKKKPCKINDKLGRGRSYDKDEQCREHGWKIGSETSSLMIFF